MKIHQRSATLILAAIFSLFALQLDAKRIKRRPPRVEPTRFDEQAKQVGTQLKLIARFLYLYGRISAGLETADEQARRGESSETQIRQLRESKASVVANIDNLRVGLETVAASMVDKPPLQAAYLKLLAASDAVKQARDLASTDHFDEAGRTLLIATERLSDLLAGLR